MSDASNDPGTARQDSEKPFHYTRTLKRYGGLPENTSGSGSVPVSNRTPQDVSAYNARRLLMEGKSGSSPPQSEFKRLNIAPASTLSCNSYPIDTVKDHNRRLISSCGLMVNNLEHAQMNPEAYDHFVVLKEMDKKLKTDPESSKLNEELTNWLDFLEKMKIDTMTTPGSRAGTNRSSSTYGPR